MSAPKLSVWTTKVEGSSVDRSEIRRAMGLLFSPGETHEIRCLSPGVGWRGSKVVSAADLDAAVAAVVDLDGTLYYSLNPIEPTARRASGKTVVRRAWMLLDVDPAAPPDVSSTDAEKAKAAEVVTAAMDFLTSLGWPPPLVIDSGNGWHLLYRIDLPNNKLAHQIVKECIYALADRCDTEHAKIDRAVHDPSRISKLPGSWARKGADTVDRPHRMARVAYEPTSLNVVPVEAIKTVGATAVKPAAKQAPAAGAPVDPWSIKATDGAGAVLTNYVKTALDKECVAISIASPGSRNHQLNTSAFNVGTMAAWPEMIEADARAAITRAAIQAGLTEHETRATFQSGWTAGAASPRVRPEPKGADAKATAATATAAGLAGKSPIKYASAIKPKRIEFLWPGRIPLGKLTTFAGHGGLGKTFVLCDISARISRGAEWPMSGGECAIPGDVLFISGEDDEDDTLVPRLMECEADLNRIAFLTDEFNDAFNLINLDIMTQAIQAMRSPRLIVIDPPTNYLDGVDDHKNAELRSAVLRPLSSFARKHKVAIVLNNHVNKSSGKDVEAACRVMGSVAWVNGVRTAYLFVRDSMDPEKVVIAPIKTNVGKFPAAITYKIVDTKDGLARVEWLAESAQSADQVVNHKSSGQLAAEWVTNLFRERRSWPSNEIRDMAKECGYSYESVFKSKEVASLPIRKTPNVTADGAKYWTWIATDPAWPKLRPESSESSESCVASPLTVKADQLSGGSGGGPKVGVGDPKVGSEQLSDAPPDGGQLSDVATPPWKSPESCSGVTGQRFASQLSELSELSDGCKEAPNRQAAEGSTASKLFKPF